jgi:hypothetical protein
MKKIYLSIAAVAICAASFAQQNIATHDYSDRTVVKERGFDFNKSKSIVNPLARTAAVTGGWFNYGQAIDAPTFNAGVATLTANYLFPDSLGYGEFGAGNFAPCWIHHIADILDIRALPFQAEASTAFGYIGSAYVVDSIALVYAYTRKHPNAAIVDTLVFTLANNATATNLVNSGFIGTTAANYGTDTLTFKKVKYTQSTNALNATGSYKFKVLLTQGDTAEVNFLEKAIKLPIPFMVPGGKLLISDVQFIPGYTYTIGTHIDYDANAFTFASQREKGAAGTFQTYYDCNYGSSACNWNSSHILTQDVRYNMGGTWNGFYIPSYAFNSPTYEHHLISYRLTETVGINELEQNGFALSQNTPNPFTSGSLIKFELVKSAKSVSFVITDVTGRILSSQSVENKVGVHTVNIGSFAAGVYYYSLNVDGKVITKKMIAQ